MDTLILMIDRVREAQLSQGALLTAIARDQMRIHEILTELLRKKTQEASMPQQGSAQTTSNMFWVKIATQGVNTAAQWLGGSLAIAFVLRGGDIGQLLQLVLQSLKSSGGG